MYRVVYHYTDIKSIYRPVLLTITITSGLTAGGNHTRHIVTYPTRVEF